MFDNVKFAMKMAAQRQRARRDMAHLMQQGDHVFRDIGLSREEVFRAQRDIKIF